MDRVFNDFIYCPYCGKKLDNNSNQQNNANVLKETAAYNYKANPIYKKIKYCVACSVICVLFTLLPFAVVATVYSMRAMDSIKLNCSNLAIKYYKKSLFWSIVAILSTIGIVIIAEVLEIF